MDNAPLIDLLYDGISDPEPWTSFLDRACERFDALACSILFHAGKSPVPVASFRTGGSAHHRARYWGRLYLVDPFVGLPADVPVTFADFSASHGGGDAQFLAEIGSPHILGIDVTLEGGALVRFRLTRSNRLTGFDAAELAACAALVPHMKRVFGLFLRLASAERARDSLALLPELLGHAVVTADCDATVLTTTPAADALLARGDGLRLAGGRIVAREAADNATLHSAIRGAGERPRPLTLRFAREGGGAPLAAVVLSGGARAPLRPEVLLLLVDPDASVAMDGGVLTQLLDLTGAEARLAVLLARGLSVAEAAVALGVRMPTVRAQLRAIFAKTGVSRQSELVRLVLAYSAAAGGSAEGLGRAQINGRS